MIRIIWNLFIIATLVVTIHCKTTDGGTKSKQPMRGSKAAAEIRVSNATTLAAMSLIPPKYSTPSVFDWRRATAPWSGNFVTSVKKQYGETCWSFSTTAAVESAMIIGGTWPVPDISNQQLLDCVYPGRDAQYYYEEGNLGWDPRIAMQYLREKGAQTLESYPYMGRDGQPPYDSGDRACHYNPSQVAQKISGVCVQKTPISSNTLKSVIFNNGPQVVQLAANYPTWNDTNAKGIISCSYDDSQTAAGNHAVLLVGYSTDAGGNDYWIIKNSWGSDWGHSGFGYISARRDQDCGILKTFILAGVILPGTPLAHIGCTTNGGVPPQPPTYWCDPWNYCLDNNGNGYLCGSTEGQNCDP